MAKGKKTGGRQKGTPNKTTAEIKALAMMHAEAAIERLALLSATAESEAVQVSAIKELLDRGIGRAPAASEDNDEAVGRIVRFITGFSNPRGGPKRG